MLQRMQRYALTRPRITKNTYGEEIPVYEAAGSILAAISTATGGTAEQNQALRVNSTHRALTQDDVRTGDRFGGYIVDYVITGTRYTQLLLTKEDAL